MFLEKLKSAVKSPVAWIATILVGIFFWHPIWRMVIEIATKAKDLLPNK